MRDSTVPLFAPESNAVADTRPAAPSPPPQASLEALHVAVGASAVPVAPQEFEVAAPPAPPAPPRQSRPIAYQQSLFQELGTVIPFPPLEPAAAKPRRGSARNNNNVSSRTKTGKRSPVSSVKNPSTPPAESMSFEFMLPDLPGETQWMGERGLAASSLAGQPGAVGEFRSPDSDIYCDVAVAPMGARALAAAMDMALVTGAFAIVGSIYYLAMQQTSAPSTAPVSAMRAALPYGILFALVAVLYKGLYAVANADSAGTRWANLKIVNFDGETPSRQERISRMVWSCLSVAAVGTGLAWSLVDEEQLTWHDLLSRTFPCERN